MRGTAYIAAVLLGTALFGQLRTGGPGYLRRMELCNAHSAWASSQIRNEAVSDQGRGRRI